MPVIQTCPKCGAALPPDAPSGFCPKCLFRLGAAEALQAAPLQGQSAPEPELPPGGLRVFGDYELLEEIARGGMGVVYKARQISLDRIVAVKMILGGALATPDFVRRFRTEAAAAAVLHHPNIVAIHEVGAQAGQHYFSMDFVEGPNLAKLVGHQPLAAGRAARYAKLIAEAIEHAHQQGILHRDLKPSNVLIDGSDQPRITDFGLAKRLDTESSLTLSGQVLGSPSFMPPEQAGGKRDRVGRHSDVYGLGGILYYLLTARPPFQADSLETIVSQVLNAEPVSPRLLNPTVPRDLETICLKCLEKDARRRYATAQELADELGRFLENKPILARPLGPTGMVWRWCRRKPVVAGLAAALMGACTLGLGGVLWQWQRAERNAQRETQQRLRAEEQSRRAEVQTRLAEARELQARKNEYIADMNLAQHALAMNNLGRSRALLEKHLPPPTWKSEIRNPKSEIDLRDWEWRYHWPLCQSDALSTFFQHSNSIGSLAFDRAGGWLAARDLGPGNLLLWDWSKRQQVAQLPGTWGGRRAVAFSPQGQLLAEGGVATNGQNVVNLWGTSTRRQIAELRHEERLVALAFSPDGSKLATFAADRTVRVWNMETRQLMANFTVSPASGEHRGVVVFSPDGAILAIGETDGRLRLIAVGSYTDRANFQAHPEGSGITALAFSADGKILASGSGFLEGTIRLWDVASGAAVGQLVGHTAWIPCLVLSPDGQTLASASADQTIRLWELASRRCRATLRGHVHEVYAVAFSPDGQTLVSGCKDGSICLWDPNPKPKATGSLTLSGRIRRLEFSPDNQTFNTLNADGSISLWDTATAAQTLTHTALGTNNTSLAISPDSALLAAGRSSGHLGVWHRVTQRELTNFLGHSAEVCHLQFRDQGRLLLSVGYDWNVKLWETTSGRELRRVQIDRNCYQLKMDASPDSRFLAIGDTRGTVNVWDTTTGSKVATLLGPVFAVVDGVAFSPNGRLLAVGSQYGVAQLYEVNSWRELTTLRGHLLGVHSVAFSPDGRRLATGSALQEAVKLWDLGTGQEVCTLEGEGAIFQFTAFSPDGNTLVSISRQGTAHLWRAPSLAEIDRSEKEKLKHP